MVCTAGCQNAIDGVIELSKAPEEFLHLLDLLLEWSGVQQSAPVDCRVAVLVGELQNTDFLTKLTLGHIFSLSGRNSRLMQLEL